MFEPITGLANRTSDAVAVLDVGPRGVGCLSLVTIPFLSLHYDFGICPTILDKEVDKHCVFLYNKGMFRNFC